MNRRHFLIRSCSIAAASSASGRFAWGGESAVAADQLIAGKSHRLIVHNGRPLEIETPLELLRAQRLTAKNALFVRNNQEFSGALTLEQAEAKGWTVEVTGLVEQAKSIDVSRLIELPQVEREMVLQCSGNGRAWFSRLAPAKGSPWQDGAVANVRFGGVPLKAVLDAVKLNVHSSAKFLCAEGRDAPASPDTADFEHSIPLADALDRSFLALRLNGEPLPALHGGPVRLVTPGYYGTMHVKWLNRLRLESQETFNHHQVARYRTPLEPIAPGSKFTYTMENSEPNWRMRIKSLIFAPLDGEQVHAGRIELRGVAFNDGAARIDAVEVSRDGGRRWERAEMTVPESPFAWYDWRFTASFEAGMHEVMCRAVDAMGRTQPLDGAVQWNPAGYAWSGVRRLQFIARS